MKNSKALLLALSFLTIGTILSCKDEDDDVVEPIPDIADALVGNYLTYDTTVYTVQGATTQTVQTGSGSVAKVSATRVLLNNIVNNACNDTAKADVTTTTLVVYNSACQDGLIISRSGTTIRYSVTDNTGGTQYRYSGRAEKQP